MNRDKENSDSDSNTQVPPDAFPSENAVPPHKKENPYESEQSIESNKEKSIDEYSITGKTPSNKKRWLFPVFLIITIVVGGYFYAQEKEINLFRILPSDLNKSFAVAPKSPKTLATQSKVVPIEPTPEIIEKTAEPNLPGKITSKNKNTINLLRDEIQSLKAELIKKNRKPLSQNVQRLMPHMSGGTVMKETEELIEEKKLEPEFEIQTSLITSPSAKVRTNISNGTLEEEKPAPKLEIQTSLNPTPPTKAKSIFKKGPQQESSPQRSKEVQAYLDFVEDTGSKFLQLIKNWSNHILALVT